MLRYVVQISMLLLLTFGLIACDPDEPAQETAAQPTSEQPVVVTIEPTEAAPAERAEAMATEEITQAPSEEVAQTPTEEVAAAGPTVEIATEGAAPTTEAPVGEPAGETMAQARVFRIVPEISKASYAVEEEFFNQPVNFFTAVGTTNDIEGEFRLDINNNQIALQDNKFTVDLRTLTSDNSRRDNRIRSDWLESDNFPFAEFTATAIENFPAEVSEGQDVSFKVIGDMTIRDVTKPATFDTTARLENNTFTGVATSLLYMRDFGFEPPSILGMLEVTDGVTVTVEFVAEEMSLTP